VPLIVGATVLTGGGGGGGGGGAPLSHTGDLAHMGTL
jgi:hypothetical protein